MKAFILVIYIMTWLVGIVLLTLFFQAVSGILYMPWLLVTFVFGALMLLFTDALDDWGIIKILIQ